MTDAEVLQETKVIKAYKEEEVKQGKLKDAVIMLSKIGLAERAQTLMKGGQVLNLRERAIYGQNAFYNINLYWSKAFGCVVEGEMFMTCWTGWCWDIRGTTTSRS